MPEFKQLPVQTNIKKIGTSGEVLTFYNEGLPNTLFAFIADENAEENNVNYNYGDLVITMKNYPDDIQYYLGKNATNYGELVVIAEDAEFYSISDDPATFGQLIYNKP